MAKTLEKTIIEITIDSVMTLTHAKNVCNQIINKAKEKLGGNWQCFIYKSTCGTYCIRYKEADYIDFSISDYSFIIFQTRD